MTFTPRPVTESEYLAALALAPSLTRDREREGAARVVAVAAAGEACPRCSSLFTENNPAEFCHYVPSRARCSSRGVWFGSAACRSCNMRDEAARALLGLEAADALPFAYVSRYFHVPADYATRAELIRMAGDADAARRPSSADSNVVAAALADLRAVGLM